MRPRPGLDNADFGSRSRRSRSRSRTGVSRNRGWGAGFTLMETMLAVVIVGVGVVAIVYAQRHFLFQNLWSTHAASATYLANELHERMRGLPRHDLTTNGLYLMDEDDPATIAGWGPESNDVEPRDFNDIDDFANAVFGSATSLPDWLVDEGFTRYAGPIDAFGDVIPEVSWDGSVPLIEVEGEQIPMAMVGWTQVVRVQKVTPNDFNTPVAISSRELSLDGTIARDVDEYPLLVTVTILYEGEFDESAPAVTSVSWVVHP